MTGAHCQQMMGEWKKAAILLEEERVTVGAVNCEQENWLCQRHQVKSYPSIVFTHPTQGWDDWYKGAHSADALYEFATGYLQSDVVHIQSAREFEQRVLDANDFWLVDFYAPWCGPCMQLKPHLRRVSVELRGLAKVAMVDCDGNAATKNSADNALPGYAEGPCSGIPQYPYLKAYPRDARLKADGAPHRHGTTLTLHESNVPMVSVAKMAREVLAVALASADSSGEDGDGEEVLDGLLGRDDADADDGVDAVDELIAAARDAGFGTRAEL